VQIKVDTGMGRMGVLAAEAVNVVMHASRQPGILIRGVYTHLATADEADLSFARLQLAAMSELIAALTTVSCHVSCFHAANSAAIFRLPDASLQMVRPGLAVYGYWAGPVDQRPVSLEPILQVESRLSAVRRMPQGASIGYGRTYRTTRESVIGVVPIGYADGYRRELSNTGIVTIESRRGAPRSRVRVVGRVSMDQISIDLTEVPDVSPGDRVTIIDNAPDAPNSVEAIARQIGTIPYEITCGLGTRIRRVPAGGQDDS
jgi:alanine racemase